MITGAVSQRKLALVTVLISNGLREAVPVELAVDTGFTGQLALPETIIRKLGLRNVGTRSGRGVRGGSRPFSLYGAVIVWNGHPTRVGVIETDGPALVGMEVLRGYLLAVECVDGGKVLITRLQEQGLDGDV